VFVIVLGASVAALLPRAGGGVLRRRDPERGPIIRSRSRAAVALAVLVACWSGPIIDIVANGGGNASAVIGSSDDLGDEETIGFEGARRVIENAIAPRPAWAQAGVGANELLRAPGTARQVAATALLTLAIAIAIACRRRHPTITAAVTVAVGAIVAGTFGTSRIPLNLFNRFATYNYLWAWAVSALLWCTVAGGLVLIVRDRVARLRPELSAIGVVACAALALVVASASLGAPHRADVVNRTIPYVNALAAEVRHALDESSTYTMELADDISAYDIGTALLDDLDRHGYTITVPPRHAPSFGERRADPDGAAGGRIVVVMGLDRAAAPDGAHQLAAFEPASRDVERLERAERAVVELIEREGSFISADFSEVNPANAAQFVHERYATLAAIGWLPTKFREAPETDDLVSAASRPVRYVAVYLLPPPE
jgi:hypothetical protein